MLALFGRSKSSSPNDSVPGQQAFTLNPPRPENSVQPAPVDEPKITMDSKMEGSGAEEANFQIFRDCLSTPLIEKFSTQPAKKTRKARGNGRRKTAINPVAVETEETNDAEELADFIDVGTSWIANSILEIDLKKQYLSLEIFTSLPASLRTLTYSTWLNTASLQALYSDPLPPTRVQSIFDPLPTTITDTITTYSLLAPNQTSTDFLTPVLTTFVSALLTPPPAPYQQRPLVGECEICQRSWIPLTYHHLIPRGVHAKVLKRGWHTEDQLNNVAWLCRACHTFVHRAASLEELAKEWYSVERLLERVDVREFGEWVGKVRWKAR
jgi:5-methylcytosine-specific restriction endonuclease McrA